MYFYTVTRRQSQRFNEFPMCLLFERMGTELARRAVV